MIVNVNEFEKLLEALKESPEKKTEILKNFKFIHAVFDKDDGIPPRFGENFRTDGPKWEKVTGLDFEAIGRILVCHLCVEHYINNLLILSTPENFDWTSSRMTFSQKLKLVSKIGILKANNLNKGIEVLNNIRNQLSHNMMATIDEDKLKQINNILMDHLTDKKSKEEKKEIISHMSNYGTHAIIERFTGIVCAKIAGYCTFLINKKTDGEDYYKFVRNTQE